MNQDVRRVFILAFWMGLLYLILYMRRKKPLSTTAYGTARWATEAMLKAAGMLSGAGVVIGRTASGALIRVRGCHGLLCGGSGSGKGVSVIIPTLLSWFLGSVLVLDVKGDLAATTAARRARRGQRIIRLAPFNGGTDAFNPLDLIPSDSPTLVDSARALSEAAVARTGMEHDRHFDDKGVQALTAILVLVLLRFDGEARSLNTVQEIASSSETLLAAADKLCEMGGLPARLGSQLQGLFDREGVLTKEGSGVMSTVARHLSFLDSQLVSRAVSHTTFAPAWLLDGTMTLYLQISPDQLEAQRGLLRCWISALVRYIGAAGGSGEVLFLIDEASALGSSLPALEEALVRGRSAGVRLLLAYQSDSQVRAAFRDKPTLLYDNTDTQIYLKPSGYETAELLSKRLGQWTQVLESRSFNEGRSQQVGSWQPQHQGTNVSQGSTESLAVAARELMRPEEILTMDGDYLIAFTRETLPIWAKRVRWYQESVFTENVQAGQPANWRKYMPPLWWLLVWGGTGLVIWALLAP